MSDSLFYLARVAAWEFLDCAGEEARAEFFEEIEKRKKKPLNEMFGNKRVDYRFVSDWSNDTWGCGRYFVYAWATQKGEIFYIGCGDECRVYNAQNRSDEFKEIYNGSDCKAYLIASFVNGESSKDIETLCIQYAQLKGYNLLNKAKTLREQEIRYFRAMEEAGNLQIESSQNLQEKYEQYKEWKQIYADSITAMDKIMADCLAIECA